VSEAAASRKMMVVLNTRTGERVDGVLDERDGAMVLRGPEVMRDIAALRAMAGHNAGEHAPPFVMRIVEGEEPTTGLVDSLSFTVSPAASDEARVNIVVRRFALPLAAPLEFMSITIVADEPETSAA
jgi:hypothetical protein